MLPMRADALATTLLPYVERSDEEAGEPVVRTSRFGGDNRALPEEFARETRQLMLRRARVGITHGVAILLAFIPVDSFRVAADRYPQAVALRLLGSALLLPFLVATRWRQADRWSESITGGALVVLVAITAA